MFLEANRWHFFRLLSGKRREMVASCLKSLYDRLHGPGADYSQNLTRDGLRELLYPVIQETANLEISAGEPASDDDLAQIHSSDLPQLANALIRDLVRDGWLESFGDRAGLVAAYRFTRAGKLFAEALWSLDRVRARSRQRNVRGCRNALEAALRNVDAYDLVDAYDYAEKVISDLSEGVEYFQELVRRLMAEASQTPWDSFMEFLSRFETDFKKQMTADNVERHRQSIREAIDRLRALEDDRFNRLSRQLEEIAPWAQAATTRETALEWLLSRTEEMVEAACTIKHPELLKAMNTYMRRAATIVQQAMLLRQGLARHAYSQAIARVAETTGEAQDRLLLRIGQHLAPAEVRLLDPVTFKIRSTAQRRRALAVIIRPKVTRESRLAAFLHRAEAEAFSLSAEDVLGRLRRELHLRGKPYRLSHLTFQSADDVLAAMQAVESIRNTRNASLRVSKLPNKLITPFYTGCDYLIEAKTDVA